MAAAMEEEFVQMKIYLDTRQKREEFKKKIGKRMLPPPPPPRPRRNRRQKAGIAQKIHLPLLDRNPPGSGSGGFLFMGDQ